MKANRTLLDDVEEIYFSIECTSSYSCEHCKNKLICDIVLHLKKSLKKYYICNKNLNLCSDCDKYKDCKIIQKFIKR